MTEKKKGEYNFGSTHNNLCQHSSIKTGINYPPPLVNWLNYSLYCTGKKAAANVYARNLIASPVGGLKGPQIAKIQSKSAADNVAN